MNTINQNEDHLGEIETDNDVSTDTSYTSDSDTDTTVESKDNDTSNDAGRSYINNGTNTEREIGGNCMVCYTDLHMFNIVNMECNHKMCSKCFPRWMSTNASCPSCRYKLSTRIQLTDEEIQREMSELNTHYLFTADKFFRRHKDYVRLKLTTDCLMARQITLYEQVEYTEGMLIGASMAIEEVDMELSKKEKRMSAPLISMKKGIENIQWMRGYNVGYERGVELINKQQNKVYDVLEVTRGNNLLDYGFTKEKLKKEDIDSEYGDKYRNKYKGKTNKRARRDNKRIRETDTDDEIYEVVEEEVV